MIKQWQHFYIWVNYSFKGSIVGSFHNVGVGVGHSVSWLLCQLYEYKPNDILHSSMYMVSDV